MIRLVNSDIIIHEKKAMFYDDAISMLPHLNYISFLSSDKNIMLDILRDNNHSKLGVYVIAYLEDEILKVTLSNMSCALDICNSLSYLVVGVYDYRSMLVVTDTTLKKFTSLPEEEIRSNLKTHLLSHAVKIASSIKPHKEKFIGFN